MKLIVAGSRYVEDSSVIAYSMLQWWLAHDRPDIEVVSGGARGVDLIGERVAEVQGFPVRRFPADWDRWGKAAGPKRNLEMAKYADALLAFPVGASRGTRHMISAAEGEGLDVTVIELTLI